MTVKKVFLSESGKPWTEADLAHPVSLVSEFKKPYVKFVVDVVRSSHLSKCFWSYRKC